jgi:hypothetical protein
MVKVMIIWVAMRIKLQLLGYLIFMDAPMTGIDGAKILCLVVVLERLNGILGNDCKKFGRAPGS